MKLIVQKSRLKGAVTIPGSKSHTIRAVAIASLAEGHSLIRSPLISSDTLSAVSTYRALGALIDTSKPSQWIITGNSGKILSTKSIIDVGNSGTTLNLAIGTASLTPPNQTVTFTGDYQTQSRPVGPLLDALNNLGARCRALRNNGKAPVQIKGQLTGGKTQIASHTSQYLSSLLLCTPLAPQTSEIEVTLLNEPGYVQMTLDWLNKQQIKYENQDFKKFIVTGGQKYQPIDCTIPADFSSATFFLCAAALYGDEVSLNGLDFSDPQPDKAVVDYLRQMGADITVADNIITIKAGQLHGAEIDMNKTPDALPAMAVVAAFAEGQTKLLNVPQARAKETDRIKCMAEELKKMNVSVEELADGLIINASKAKPADLNGRGDHRIVMAMSLAAMALDGQSTIDTAEAVSVTFPDYVKLMKSIGANMEIIK
jgi:3-phosphoshikimate 1-carboxyvinyltransferase